MSRAPVFVRHLPPRRGGFLDPARVAEEAALAMLYRRQVEFAVGHGCAAHAVVAEGDSTCAVRLETCVLPRFEVARETPPSAQEIPQLAGLALDMQQLGELPAADAVLRLLPLVEAYREWIETQQLEVLRASDLAPHRAAAQVALDGCRSACQRIRAGIELLGRDVVAAEAFRFMNRAMAQQRVRSVLAERRRGGEPFDLGTIDVPANRSWYPFQLAFILQCLPGLTDLAHPDRSDSGDAIADLLWFPTGGGKTEAYLGLAAYAMVLRRLQGAVGGRLGGEGVAVLMRYTLRLLTLQQFQRALALICACEVLRREALASGDDRLGETPFRLGLWVGGTTTPNTTQQSYEAVRDAHGRHRAVGAFGRRGDPFQLTACPWCGETLERGRDLTVERCEDGRGRTYLHCGDPLGRCPFSRRQSPDEGIPAVVVDEEIFRLLPAMLIGTVDKFAQLPWVGASQMLFGQVADRCPRHGFRHADLGDPESHPKRGLLAAVRVVPTPCLRPPDLVIQDELHLISGPLGTLVSLYETAVDELMTWEVDGRRIRPKVVASTATVRRAQEQVHGVFHRAVEIFPPHGIDIADRFFARRRDPASGQPGRLYFGVCATGKRVKGALIRAYVTLLSAAQRLFDDHGAAADTWMTLVGYFNSMRELGGMRRAVQDDVFGQLKKMSQRGLANRRTSHLEELTSRKRSADIPKVLDLLACSFEARRDGAPSRGGVRPLDVLLATNMLSVGVDVPRLGMMVVAGQPKATAEYIQATSRVGRRQPGLVAIVYNWSRPRDLSHFERFEHYHATFYQHVEPLSVTPFSPRALDRGLSAQLVALTRLAGLDLSANSGAQRIERDHPAIRHAIDVIVRRAGAVTQSLQVADEVRAALLARLDVWLARIRRLAGGARLCWQGEGEVDLPLLRRPGVEGWSDFTCPLSLRDVEPAVKLLFDDRGMDEAPPPAAALADDGSALNGGDVA